MRAVAKPKRLFWELGDLLRAPDVEGWTPEEASYLREIRLSAGGGRWSLSCRLRAWSRGPAASVVILVDNGPRRGRPSSRRADLWARGPIERRLVQLGYSGGWPFTRVAPRGPVLAFWKRLGSAAAVAGEMKLLDRLSRACGRRRRPVTRGRPIRKGARR